MNPTPAPEARQPKNRLALVSLVAALYAPVAAPVAYWLHQLRVPPVCKQGVSGCPPVAVPVIRLRFNPSAGLLVLIIPAVLVALVSGHIALSRMRYQSAPKYRRNVALWGLTLGYITVVALGVWVAYSGVLASE